MKWLSVNWPLAAVIGASIIIAHELFSAWWESDAEPVALIIVVDIVGAMVGFGIYQAWRHLRGSG